MIININKVEGIENVVCKPVNFNLNNSGYCLNYKDNSGGRTISALISKDSEKLN